MKTNLARNFDRIAFPSNRHVFSCENSSGHHEPPPVNNNPGPSWADIERAAEETRRMLQGGSGNTGGGNTDNNPAPSYQGDVAHLVARSVTLHGNQHVVPGLTSEAVNADTSRLTIHEVGKAAELNQQYLSQEGNRGHVAPHQENRLVADYRPDQEGHFVRTYDNVHSNEKGRSMTTAGEVDGLKPSQIQDALQTYYTDTDTKRIEPLIPTHISQAATNPEEPIRRSVIGGSLTGATQYGLLSGMARFFGKKQL